MKVCTSCGAHDNPYWRSSRFEMNCDYMRWEDFKTEYPSLAKELENKQNHVPVEERGYFYYRRGTGGIEVYRVWHEDYKMPRERKNHKAELQTYDASILDVNDQ